MDLWISSILLSSNVSLQEYIFVSGFTKSKKKDDLADTVMQALSYSPEPVTVSTPKKIVARQPNENQKRTKYSKSNLVWLTKNSPGIDLSKDKRFMKDLSRYYTSLDDFLKSI